MLTAALFITSSLWLPPLAIQDRQQEKAEQDRLRELYGARTELSPKITELSFIGDDALNLAIQAGRVELAPMRPYQPEPGDQKVTENSGNTVKLVRGGQEMGWLVGRNRATLKPYEKLIGDPLLDEFAADPSQFTLTSDADPNYRSPVAAVRLERKSKPNDAAQPSFEMAMLHRLYLWFPHKLKPGLRYTLNVGGLNTQQPATPFVYEPAMSISEAIHVSQIGFRPDDPVKTAFVSLWAGTGGGQDFGERDFEIRNAVGATLLKGRTKKVLDKGAQETLARAGNFSSSSVYQIDFSALNIPGSQHIFIPGIGRSLDFEIGTDVWRRALTVQMRGLFHNRSGIELKAPHSSYRKPADMRPGPNTTVTWSAATVLDDGQGGEALAAKDTGEPADGWGGWHDAGDWNPRRVTHLTAAAAAMEVMEMFPGALDSVKLNIPKETKAPDILDEIKWEIDCFRRLQKPDGGVSWGLETVADPYPGEVSWNQSMKIYAWSPDAHSSWVYAAHTMRFSELLKKWEPALAAEYRSSAMRAMVFAESDYDRRKQEGKEITWEARDARCMAALIVYRATADNRWLNAAHEDYVLMTPGQSLQQWGKAWQSNHAYIYASLPAGMGSPNLKRESALALDELAQRAAAYSAQNAFGIASSDAGKPMINGFFTGPNVIDVAQAHKLNGKAEHLATILRAAQFSAGANPMNTTFTTGLGSRNAMALKLDTRATGQAAPEGLTIYGVGDWQAFPGGFHDWPITYHVSRTAIPNAFIWPFQEALFEVFLFPGQLEYTVDQWAPNIYIWAYLAARK